MTKKTSTSLHGSHAIGRTDRATMPQRRIAHDALPPRPYRSTALASTLAGLGLLFAACNGEDQAGRDPRAQAESAITTPAAGPRAVHLAKDNVVLWSNAPGGVALALDGAGNVYTVADAGAVAGGDITLTRRSASGTVGWSRTHDNTLADRYEQATTVAASGNGDAFVGGTERMLDTGAEAGGVLSKFAPDGTLAWRVDAALLGMSSVTKVLVDAAGTSYVLGMSTPAGGTVAAATLTKVNAAGSAVWTWRDTTATTIIDPGSGEPITVIGIGPVTDLVWGGDGRLIVIAGTGIFGVTNGFDVVDPATGAVTARQLYITRTSVDVASDADGSIYVVHGANCRCTVFARYTPDGSLLWERVGGSIDPMLQIEVGPDNLPVVGGIITGAGYLALKYNADGNQQLWRLSSTFEIGSLRGPMRLDSKGNLLLPTSANRLVTISPDGVLLGTSPVLPTDITAMAVGVDGTASIAGPTATLRLDSAADGPPPPPPPPPPSTDLRVLSLAGSKPSVLAGETVQYTAVFDNAGPLAAPFTSLVVNIPPGAVLEGISATLGTCALYEPDPTLAFCNLDGLPVGERVTMNFALRLITPGATAVRTGVVTGMNDPDVLNNELTVTTEVSASPPPPPPPPKATDLAVLSLTDSADPVRRGDRVTYRAVVTNTGTMAATKVRVAAHLPGGARLKNIETSQGRCDEEQGSCRLGTLDVGQQVNITYEVRLRTVGANTMRVDVSSQQPDLDTANNSMTQTTMVRK